MKMEGKGGLWRRLLLDWRRIIHGCCWGRWQVRRGMGNIVLGLLWWMWSLLLWRGRKCLRLRKERRGLVERCSRGYRNTAHWRGRGTLKLLHM